MSNTTFESFILQTYIEDLDLCDDIIEAYTISPNKRDGLLGFIPVVNKDFKDTSEIFLDDCPEVFNRYALELQKCVNSYIEKYETCNWYSPFSLIEKINIQHYEPGNSYRIWHTERCGPMSNRHLVFMTYLNDVTDGGGTEFYNQKLITHPKKGLTLIWPADWTHTHRGIKSSTQHKYIVTGWLSYVEKLTQE